MARTRLVLACVLLAAIAVGCGKKPAKSPVTTTSGDAAKKPDAKPDATPGEGAQAGGVWSAEKVTEIAEGLAAPESILPDPANKQVYVSNVEAAEGAEWTDDAKAYIMLLEADGKVKNAKWLESKAEQPLNGPKGMCVLNGKLYFADNRQLKRCDAANGANPEHVGIAGRQLNDVATDGKAAWVSDMEAGKIYRVDPAGGIKEVKAPAAVNGVTCWKDKVFAVSWGQHDIYEIDPAGEKDPTAFGLADQFKNLDGIEVLDDGTFVVSDNTAGKVFTVGADRKTVKVLAEIETPADIGIDRAAGMLYVPQLRSNKVVIFKLTKK